jgi:hypothetical protein
MANNWLPKKYLNYIQMLNCLSYAPQYSMKILLHRFALCLFVCLSDNTNNVHYFRIDVEALTNAFLAFPFHHEAVARSHFGYSLQFGTGYQ